MSVALQGCWAGLPSYNSPAQLELAGVLLEVKVRPGWVLSPWFHVRGYENCLCCPSSDIVLLPRSFVGLSLSGCSHHAAVPQAFLRLVWLWTKTGSQVLSGGGEGMVWVPRELGSSVWY